MEINKTIRRLAAERICNRIVNELDSNEVTGLIRHVELVHRLMHFSELQWN